MNSRTVVITLIFSAVALAHGRAQTACDIGWSAPVRVSSDSSVSTLPDLSVRGDTVHLLWFGLDTTAGGTLSQSGLRYARSTDGGGSFSSPVSLLSPFESLPGHVASNGDRVFITAAAILDTFFGIVLFSSTDGGTTWSAPAGVLRSAYPEILFMSGRDLYIGYREIETASFGILRSTDDGRTWVTIARRIPGLSDVEVSGDRFHAVGPTPGASQTEVGYYLSPDSGGTWSGPTIISPEDLVRSAYPGISRNDSGIFFSTWTDTGAVVFRFSRNGGISWGSWNRLSDEPGSVKAVLDSDGDFVMVVWDRDIGGARGIRGRMSNDQGENFCPVMYPAGGSAAGEPSLVVLDSAAHLAWIAEAGVFYRRGILPRNTSGGGLPPASFALGQSYPNPTNGFAFIGFEIPVPAPAAIGIYNVLGELVHSVGPKSYAPGRYVEPV
ncbi:MAG TPA: hypothetical protein VI932_04285, partial [Bacteroidota bacterium]|nr:hypothetical protein [Bacteroidota bacterium]